MNAIVTPLPEPLTREPVPEVTVEPTRVRLVRPLAAVVIIGILAAATLVTWDRTGRTVSQDTNADPLTTQLAWMFDAALTYPGRDRSGQPSTPPFSDITIDSVIVVDPSSGPITAVGRATLSDGTVEGVTYWIEVTRSGDDWTVRAERLTATEADRTIRPGGS